MTTFKAVDGWTTENEVQDVRDEYAGLIRGYSDCPDYCKVHLPCTIIPGHWASRIESGVLLTLDEWTAIRDGVDLQPNPLHNAIVIAVCTQIARKLRGEA